MDRKSNWLREVFLLLAMDSPSRDVVARAEAFYEMGYSPLGAYQAITRWLAEP